MLVYVGTYTGAKSKGIYLFRMDPATGALTPAGLAGEVTNPSFLAVGPGGKFLYAVGEIDNFGGKKSGAVSAFSIDPASGKLALLNQQSSGGGGPCHLSVDAAGRNVLVANYGTGSIADLPIGPDGKLAEASTVIQHKGKGPDPKRQEGPHAHCISPDPNGKFVLACDLGLDEVLVYHFDSAKGALTPNDPPAGKTAPGSGPRHLAFHPTAPVLYVITEMGSTVTAFNYDPEAGTMKEFQTMSALPDGYKGNSSCAEIAVHPSGRFVYGSNRSHDSIVIYSADEKTGRLTLVGHQPTQGKNPRNFAIDPSGKFLIAANQDSANLVVFAIDQKTGELKPTGATAEVDKPVCVTFLKAGKS